jgi:antirestriction protein
MPPYAETLDIRTIAQDWRDELDLPADERDADSITACEKLAGDLLGFGSEPSTPDDLEAFGDNYECILIPKRDFEQYAEELAEELGLIPEGNQWPTYCIDWERAARELAMDYTSVTYAGTDYLIRSW